MGIDKTNPIDPNDENLLNDDYDYEFYTKNSLKYYFNKYKCDWHLALNRFTSILPSLKSKMDQSLYSSSFQTISKMLYFQSKNFDNTSFNLNKLKDAKQAQNSNNNNNNQVTLLSNLSKTNNFEDLDNLNSMLFIDKWSYNMIYSPNSSLLLMMKQFLAHYETDEIRINSYILPLCDFIKTYFDRLSLLNEINSIDYLLPPIELLKICIEQMQACEIDKFRNLNKLAILINLIGSLLSVGLFNIKEQNSSTQNVNNSNTKLFIQLIKSLVLIINTFNIGRGGLSLSFMGNFITKSAHVSLLQLVKNILLNSDNEQNKLEIVKAVLCLKDHKNSLHGSSWLIPLMLHREPQIRCISFSLISLLINVPFARKKLLTNKTGIWSIALNVLLNRFECSIVRTQACAFLINLTQSMSSVASSTPSSDDSDDDETNISTNNLKSILNEFNFYQQIALILTSFYPFETYSFNELKQQNQDSLKKNSSASFSNEDLSICSPLLVSSICQLLYNLNILLSDEAILMINNNGIISLLISYVKPMNLLTKHSTDKELKLNEDLIDMLEVICRYLNLCCQMDQNCVLMLLKNQQNNLVYDLVGCLNINATNKEKLKPFYSTLFELLSTFLNYYEDKSIVEKCLIIISKCWLTISNFVLNELLVESKESVYEPSQSVKSKYSNLLSASSSSSSCNQLFENGLKFYSIYLSKLTQLSSDSENIQILSDNISYLFEVYDVNSIGLNICAITNDPSNTSEDSDVNSRTLGGSLCRKLIKQFDKYFLVDTNLNLKLIISNIMKALFALSDAAKKVAVNSGLIETLIEHLKYTHSKLNLRSLSSKGPLKENSLFNDLQQSLLILKYLMSNSLEIKESITKNGLQSIIHTFWCWALQDQNLLKAALSTLCTLTANNKLAINLMAQSNVSAQTSNASGEARLTNANGLSLLYSIIKTLQKSFSNPKAFFIQKYAFSLLANCAQSNECKNIIWKSNLLQDFTTIDFQANKSTLAKLNYKKEKLWLTFLVSLSFSPDGQQFFMKVESLLTRIIKIIESVASVQNQQYEIQDLSLLILRNLAFNPANKSKLVSHSNFYLILFYFLAFE